jgi:FkbM family methyltransferase
MLLKSLANRYLRLRGYPLAGPLAGCYMRGNVPESYQEGSYEPEVCKAITRIVQPGWVCVDVGAHIGYFTLLLAKLVGEQGRIIAFEAHPVNARSVNSNIKINGYETRALVENMAVTDGTSSRVKLFPGRRHSSAEWNIVGHDLEGNLAQPELAVPATSLDAYFLPRSHVDFIKMDIERAEAQALRGMRRLLQECRAFVLVEFHDENGWAARQELFTSHYRLYDLTEARWLDGELDVQRVYHCLAVPEERSAGIRL